MRRFGSRDNCTPAGTPPSVGSHFVGKGHVEGGPADRWERARVEVVERDGTDPDGQPFTWRDNVMVLRRHA